MCYLIVFQCIIEVFLSAGCFAQKNEKKRENSSPLLVLAFVANF